MSNSTNAFALKPSIIKKEQNVLYSVIAGIMLVFLMVPVDAQPSTIWTRCDSTPRASALFSVAGTERLFVVVGDSGTILSSVNAQAWVKTDSSTKLSLRAVTPSESLFVAVGDSGIVLASSDGSAWIRRISGTTANLRGITWTGKKFVAVGDTGSIITSSDGNVWVLCSRKTTADLNAVTKTDTQIIAAGKMGTILTSSDGAEWKLFMTAGSEIRSIAWSGSQLFAVVDWRVCILKIAADTILFSSGRVRTEIWEEGPFNSIVGTDDQMLVGGSGRDPLGGSLWEGRGQIFISNDFPRWSETDVLRDVNTIYAIAQTSNKYIAVGNNGSIFTAPRQIFVQERCE